MINLKNLSLPVKVVKTLVLLSGLIGGCTGSRRNDVLLQIGSYQLTAADYEFAGNSTHYRTLAHEQLQNKLIEEGRILAYALEHQYDTISMLNLQLEYAMRYYASSVDGYVWNKEIKPLLQVTAEDIRKAYAMRSDEYHIRFIHFPTAGLLRKYYSTDHPIASASEFYALKEKVKADPDVVFNSTFNRYPFYPLGIYLDKMAQANTGDVWGPLETLSGYYMVHLAGKRSIPLPPYEQEQARIHQELLNSLKEKYIWECQQQVIRTTHPRLHEAAIAEMAGKADPREKKWPGVDPGIVLMEYDFDGTHRNYTAADFFEFARCQPVFTGSLSNPDDVQKMLHSHLIGICLFAKARQLNMESDFTYQLFKKRYQQNILITYYKQQHIYPKIAISETDLENYYKLHQQEFTCFANATAFMYKFPDMQSAFEGRKVLMEQHTPALPASKEYTMSRKINTLPEADVMQVQIKDTIYNKAVIDIIAGLPPGGISMPMPADGDYQVIYLSTKNGTAPMPYKYAREIIRDLLFAKKETELIAELEARYPIKVNHIKNLSVQ